MPRLKLKIARRYIGIDPGKNGGMVTLYEDGKPHSIVKMPPTEKDICDWVRQWRAYNTFAVIESINTGNPGTGKSQMANLYGSYMSLRMTLVACGIRFEAVTTAKAARSLGIPPRKKTEGRVQWKNRLKAKAQELFPREKVTLAVCDALLFAEYCRRTSSA